MSVTVRLIGGIGNQMFQYAAARNLAHRLDTDLKLDITGFRAYPDRKYSLDCFQIHAEIANMPELERYKRLIKEGPNTLSGKLRRKILPWQWQPVIRERMFTYDPGFRKIRFSCYLDGYWQSEKYFRGIADTLRKEFTFRLTPAGEQTTIRRQILEAGSRAVSLHVRRGDYVSNPEVRAVHGALGTDYYHRAMSWIETRVNNPVYFVFSDDMDWARANITSRHTVVYADLKRGGFAGRDQVDLWLMSQCPHHIIANSSFSWWGAWLGSRGDKWVVAPRQWFTEEAQKKKPVNDLIPERWEQI